MNELELRLELSARSRVERDLTLVNELMTLAQSDVEEGRVRLVA